MYRICKDLHPLIFSFLLYTESISLQKCSKYSLQQKEKMEKYCQHIHIQNDSDPIFYFYFGNISNCVILVKFKRKYKISYRMYLWNTINNTIEKGQWLLKGVIRSSQCFVSENCEYFSYKLKRKENETYPTIYYSIVSIPPYFSHIYNIYMDKDELLNVKWTSLFEIKLNKFELMYNKHITSSQDINYYNKFTTEKGQIKNKNNNIILLNVNNDTFTNIKPLYITV